MILRASCAFINFRCSAKAHYYHLSRSFLGQKYECFQYVFLFKLICIELNLIKFSQVPLVDSEIYSMDILSSVEICTYVWNCSVRYQVTLTLIYWIGRNSFIKIASTLAHMHIARTTKQLVTANKSNFSYKVFVQIQILDTIRFSHPNSHCDSRNGSRIGNFGNSKKRRFFVPLKCRSSWKRGIRLKLYQNVKSIKNVHSYMLITLRMQKWFDDLRCFDLRRYLWHAAMHTTAHSFTLWIWLAVMKSSRRFVYAMRLVSIGEASKQRNIVYKCMGCARRFIVHYRISVKDWYSSEALQPNNPTNGTQIA